MVVGKFLDMSGDSGGGELLPVNWSWAFVGPGAAAMLGALATICVARRLAAGDGPKDAEEEFTRSRA